MGKYDKFMEVCNIGGESLSVNENGHYETVCVHCGKKCETTGEVTIVQLLDYMGGMTAQEAFPNLNAFDREMIISKSCYDCQENIFNTPAPGHESKFGKRVGECVCCGSPIWEKDKNKGGAYKCAQCYSVYPVGCDE